MIHITQLIFLREGKEDVFNEFEANVIPFFEIHFVSFGSERNFENLMKEPERLKFLHLKQESVKSTLLVTGAKTG